MTERRAAQRIGRDQRRLEETRFLPLALLALPPMSRTWEPQELNFRQGALLDGHSGSYYGDGSGIEQNSQIFRRATWSLVLDGGGLESIASDEDICIHHFQRGNVGGWHPNVPRGELCAVVRFLYVAGSGSTYNGDCQYVIRGMSEGVPRRLRGSAAADADLGRLARRLLDERRGNFTFIKIKAHRARATAEAEGEEALKDWHGNRVADIAAKSLARQLRDGVSTQLAADQARERSDDEAVIRLAVAAGWSIHNWVTAMPKLKRTPRAQRRLNDGADCGAHTVVARTGGGVICTTCRLFSTTVASLKSLRNRPCAGSLASQCHSSHRKRFLDGVTWCRRCGSYATKRPRALREPCVGYLATEAKRNVVKRLCMGLLPTTARYLRGVAHDHVETLTQTIHQPNRSGPSGRRPHDDPPRLNIIIWVKASMWTKINSSRNSVNEEEVMIVSINPR